MPIENDGERKVVPCEYGGRTWSYVVELGVLVVIIVVSVLLLVEGGPGVGSNLIGPLLSRLVGAAGVVLGLMLTGNVVQLLRGKSPALQITPEGVLNRTYSATAALVSWDEILDVRKTRKPAVLEIVLRDPETFCKRQTLTTRLFMRAASLFVGPGRFLVFLPQLGGPRTEVLDRLRGALDVVELAAVRDQRLLDDPQRDS
jgi:hypothetical protein